MISSRITLLFIENFFRPLACRRLPIKISPSKLKPHRRSTKMKSIILAAAALFALLGTASAWEFPPKWDGGYLGFYGNSKSKNWPQEAAKLVQIEADNRNANSAASASAGATTPAPDPNKPGNVDVQAPGVSVGVNPGDSVGVNVSIPGLPSVDVGVGA